MAAFYVDNDVAQAVAALLHARGHAAVTARQLGLHQAADAVHLLTAAEHGWILVTHNMRDYVMLHEVWLTRRPSTYTQSRTLKFSSVPT